MTRIIIITRRLYKRDKNEDPIFPSEKKTHPAHYLLLLQGWFIRS